MRLLFNLGLRRGEVANLDISDVELLNCRIAVLGKGKASKIYITLPEPTIRALSKWLLIRGEQNEGSLFINFDRAGKGERLTDKSIYYIVSQLGKSVGVKVSPHGIRHTAITNALDLTNGNVREVQRFSRHKDIRTLNIYDDNRQDLAGNIAKLISTF